MDFVQKVKLFNEIAGTKEEFDSRKIGLYIGLIAEEFGELIQSLNHSDWLDTVMYFDELSEGFKSGRFDEYIEAEAFNKVEALDACVDICVVSLGGGIAVGADIEGACNAVADNNLTKFPLVDGVHTVLRDDNGKVKKPEGYSSVQLNEFIRN